MNTETNVFYQGVIRMRGIKKLTVYSRKVVSGKDSQLDVRAPTLSPQYDTSLSLAPGTPGVPGQNGVAGPKGTGVKRNREFNALVQRHWSIVELSVKNKSSSS